MEDSEIIERRIKERERVIEDVRKFAESLEGAYSVLLAGSYAKGDFNVWSDVDVVVVGDFRGSPIERLRAVDAPPGFEVIPLTKEELIGRIKRGDPLAVDLVNYGVLVRDDLGLGEELARLRAQSRRRRR